MRGWGRRRAARVLCPEERKCVTTTSRGGVANTQVPSTLLSQGVKKKALNINPQCGTGGCTWDPPKPQGGRSTRRTQHIGGAGDGGGEEGSSEDDADGPNAVWSRSKQALLAAGWVPTKPTDCVMGSLMVALSGSITKALISGRLTPVLSLDQVSHPSLIHPWYFLSIIRISLAPSANKNSHLIMWCMPYHVSYTGDPETRTTSSGPL